MDNEEATAVEISPAVQNFLREYIQAVWQLELLLFLKESASPLTAKDIAVHLYSSAAAMENALSTFVNAGILKVEDAQSPKYSFAPVSAELSNVIEQASSAYSSKRLAVTNFIFSQRTKKVI